MTTYIHTFVHIYITYPRGSTWYTSCGDGEMGKCLCVGIVLPEISTYNVKINVVLFSFFIFLKLKTKI